MPIRKITTDDVENKIMEAISISTTPNTDIFPVYKEGEVIDEEQSVRWNREEVIRRNEAHAAERIRLFQVRSKAYKEAEALALDYIKQELNINDKQASILYNYVYEEYHSYVDTLVSKLDELIDVYKDIKAAE